MSAFLVKTNDKYSSSKHKTFQLNSKEDLAKLPKLDECAIGSEAYLIHYSQVHVWVLCEDNKWKHVGKESVLNLLDEEELSAAEALEYITRGI